MLDTYSCTVTANVKSVENRLHAVSSKRRAIEQAIHLPEQHNIDGGARHVVTRTT